MSGERSAADANEERKKKAATRSKLVLCIVLIDTVEFSKLDAHHVLRVLTNDAFVARRFDGSTDALGGLSRVLFVSLHMDGEKGQRVIFESVIFPQIRIELLRIATDHALTR